MMCLIVAPGFVMLTIGVALLLVGETPFLAGKTIPAMRARLIGLVLVSFLPMALAMWFASRVLFGPEAVHGLVFPATLFVLCWLAVAMLMFRVVFPRKAPRAKPTAKVTKASVPEQADEPTSVPVETDVPAWMAPAPEPAPKPAKKPRKAPVEERDPFDFS